MKTLATAPMKLLLIAVRAFALNVSKAMATEEETIVVGKSALEVAQYLNMRLMGKAPLQRRFDPEAQSYWIERRPAGPEPQSMRHQF